MQTNNPVLSRYEKPGFAFEEGQQAYANAGTMPPPAGPRVDVNQVLNDGAGLRITLNDVIMKCAALFALCVVFAVVGYNFADSSPWVWIVGALGTMVLGLVNAFMRKVSVPLILLYGVASGLFLGGISFVYNGWVQSMNPQYTGLILQAVIGTMTTFGVMLFLYATRIIKVNGRFAMVMMGALISYALIGFASLIAAIFGVGGGWGFYGVGTWGLLLCIIGVALAAFTLMLDFEAIAQAIAMGAPEKESWRLAFGLLVTLVWLYLEILRFLAIFAGSRN